MSVNLGQITATTLKNRQSEVVDNISNHNRLLNELRKKGKWTSMDGGRTIDCPIDYVENGTVKWYSGGQDSWSVPVEEVIDAATYDWKFLGAFTYYTEAERVKNRGKHAAVRLMNAKIKNMERSVANTVATALYSDGTGSSGQEIGGLQLLIDDDPTSAGTVGGINQATQAFWRNYTSGSQTLSSSNIKTWMNTAWLKTIRGTDRPDLILADDTMFTYYWDSLSDLQRFTSADSADVTDAEGLMYQSAKVYFDDQCPSKRMYMVDTNTLEFVYAPGRMFSVEDARTVTNANYDVIPMFFAGNLICSRRAGQAVIIDD